MDIDFDNPKHERLVNDKAALKKKFNKKGLGIAEEITVVFEVLRAADTLFDIPPGFRPHPLKGVYKGCFAVNVDNLRRVIFKPNKTTINESFQIDNPKSIKAIMVIEICKNYHK